MGYITKEIERVETVEKEFLQCDVCGIACERDEKHHDWEWSRVCVITAVAGARSDMVKLVCPRCKERFDLYGEVRCMFIRLQGMANEE